MHTKIENNEKNKEIALYIHIPFCKQKCLYCDFPSYSGKENLMLEYSETLAKEIKSIPKRKIKTIFIGGGTPTYLSLEGWKKIKCAIDKLDKSEDIEFTVEGNPGTFSEEKLEFLKSMGVNRLSIGLQAWQNGILKKIGRIHDIDDFLNSFNLARKKGFKNINVDLMFGLPGQTIYDWKETLEEITKLSPEHISCYSLIVEEGTPFYSLYKKDKLNLPKEDIEREMSEYLIDFLKEKGYFQYEISNFAKKHKECRHNLIYWNLEEYVGCGSGAHSYINKTRYRNSEKIEEYILNMSNDKNVKLDKQISSLNDEMEEFMFMGLRKINGVSIYEFEKRFGKDIYDVYGDVIYKYLKNKMLINGNGRLFLSERGIEISNSIMSEFIF